MNTHARSLDGLDKNTRDDARSDRSKPYRQRECRKAEEAEAVDTEIIPGDQEAESTLREFSMHVYPKRINLSHPRKKEPQWLSHEENKEKEGREEERDEAEEEESAANKDKEHQNKEEEGAVGRYQQYGGSPRGLCLIINNLEFEGAVKDEVNLEHLFKTLGFNVEVHKKKSKHKIDHIVRDAAKRDHSQSDIFVAIVRAHGGYKDELLGCDGRSIRTKDIMEEFTRIRCPTLSGKPKVFFLHSCRAEEERRLTSAGHSRADNKTRIDGHLEAYNTFPNEGDFLLAFSSLPDAYRDDARSSSDYIQTLVQTIRSYHQTSDLLSILLKVSNEMRKRKMRQTLSLHIKLFPYKWEHLLFSSPNLTRPKAARIDFKMADRFKRTE